MSAPAPSLTRSRLVWLLVIIGTAALGKVLGRYLPEPLAGWAAQILADEVLALAVPLLAGAGIVLKAKDRAVVAKLLAQAGQAPGRPRVVDRRGELGFVRADLLAKGFLGLMLAALVILAVLVQVGCGSAWPAACTQGVRGDMACRCGHVDWRIRQHPTKARPAGRVVPLCDDAPLPFVIDADNVEVPHGR